MLYALRSDDPAGERLRELVAEPLVDDAEHAEALPLLRASRGAGRGPRDAALGYAERARATRWTRCPTLPARAALAALTELVIARTG